MKRGKKYIEAAKLIERGNLYDKEEAVALVKKAAVAKFDETIEAHIRTGCDGRHADQHLIKCIVILFLCGLDCKMIRIIRLDYRLSRFLSPPGTSHPVVDIGRAEREIEEPFRETPLGADRGFDVLAEILGQLVILRWFH